MVPSRCPNLRHEYAGTLYEHMFSLCEQLVFVQTTLLTCWCCTSLSLCYRRPYPSAGGSTSTSTSFISFIHNSQHVSQINITTAVFLHTPKIDSQSVLVRYYMLPHLRTRPYLTHFIETLLGFCMFISLIYFK